MLIIYCVHLSSCLIEVMTKNQSNWCSEFWKQTVIQITKLKVLILLFSLPVFVFHTSSLNVYYFSVNLRTAKLSTSGMKIVTKNHFLKTNNKAYSLQHPRLKKLQFALNYLISYCRAKFEVIIVNVCGSFKQNFCLTDFFSNVFSILLLG